MKLNVQKGRMFKSVTHTGSFIYGCDHMCAYPCYARFLTEMWGRSFEPRLVQKDKTQVLKVRDAVIFLNSMGDICCPGIKDEWIIDMLKWIALQDPSNKFLIQTKNIKRLGHIPLFEHLFPIKDQIRLGTTIESTDMRHNYSQAPNYLIRAGYLSNFKRYGFETFLSGEPLLQKLDPELYYGWVKSIDPIVTEFGLLNYREHSKLALFQIPDRTDPHPRDYEVLRNLMIDGGHDFIEKDNIVAWRKTEKYRELAEL